MEKIHIDGAIYSTKRAYFDGGNTKSYSFRIQQLQQLKQAIKQKENAVVEALKKDLNKPEFEAFTSEVGFVYNEIDIALKKLRKWMRARKVGTPLVLEASRSKIISEPLGVVLIIGPWNYPFQLVLSPLVGAIAAGNCVVLKPSEETPATAQLIEDIISEGFKENYISVIQGDGNAVGTALLKQFAWNHVFFTGSSRVGSKIAELASAHLSPVTLELGGKSPAIVDENSDLDKAAKRIVFGKFFNAGQTCVSPDYVLVYAKHKEALVERMKHYIDLFYGSNCIEAGTFTRILNEKRFEVLDAYLKQGHILKGGGTDKQKLMIEPTLMDDVKMDSPIMQDEIFGPLLPVFTWEQKSELLEIIRKNRYPLACYIFTNTKAFENYILDYVEFGGGAVNNTIVHLVNPKLPFGGVGNSGQGSYHGKYSFDVFSHKKSILKTSTRIDLPLRYPPYTEQNLKRVKLFFK